MFVTVHASDSMKTTVVVLALQCVIGSVAVNSARAQDTRLTRLTWVDRTGTVIDTVGPSDAYRGIDISSDGKRVVVHQHNVSPSPPQPAAGRVLLVGAGSSAGTSLPLEGIGAAENTMPIWSPDGTRIAYGSMRHGKGGIYVKRVGDAGHETRLIESETTKVPMSWSPDGRFIIYWTPGDVQWVLPLSGDRKPWQLSTGVTSHAQISPDGKSVAYVDHVSDPEIYVRPFSTTPDVQNGSRDAIRVSRNGGVFPRWRGDSKELYFLSSDSNGKMMAAEIDVATGRRAAPQVLFDAGTANFGHQPYHVFAVARDGSRFLIPRIDPTSPVNDGSARTLTLLDRDGRTTATLGAPGRYQNLSFSPDGSRVALLRDENTTNAAGVWVMDTQSQRMTLIASGERREFEIGRRDAPQMPVWSPDGTYVAYIATREGTQAIYRKRSDGTGEENRLFTLPGYDAALEEWTADNRYITYYAPQLGGNIQFALPLVGEQSPIELARSRFPMVAARLSPDNRLLAFRSDETGKDEVWVTGTSLVGNSAFERRRVSVDGGGGPIAWRSDGKELYFLASDRAMMAVGVHLEPEVKFDAPRRLFTSPPFPPREDLTAFASVTRDGEQFLFSVPRPAAPPGPLPQLTLFDDTGATIKRLDDGRYFGLPVFSPDGSRVLARKFTEGDNSRAMRSELWSLPLRGEGRLVAIGPGAPSAAWSPDGRYVYYLTDVQNGQDAVLVRKRSDGTGTEEVVYRPVEGVPLYICDISPDGRFMALESGDVLLMLPLEGNTETRQPFEFMRESYSVSRA
jgi:Tol biopolymer transport system component